jgi:catechol 2,3-dioxygenase
MSNNFSLPVETHIGHVHLRITDLERSLAFYRDLLGFSEVKTENGHTILSATGGPPYHLLLSEQTGARRRPANTTGLYHLAIRLPERASLAHLFKRLADHGWPLQGAADHKVSEAIYLADPDGNGLELYVDRPREQWPWEGDQIAMATDPLDINGLLSELTSESRKWTGIHPKTDIGHVHLNVADLAEAEDFYHGLLGFDVTQRNYPGALFFSAGGYHHHVGANIWAGMGAPPPPADSTGLISFALSMPDGEAWNTLLARLEAYGVAVENIQYTEEYVSALIKDPSQNGIELLVKRI